MEITTGLCIHFLVSEWDACEGEEPVRSQQLAEKNALVWPCEVTQQSSITWHLVAELVHTPTPQVMQHLGGKDLPETCRKQVYS